MIEYRNSSNLSDARVDDVYDDVIAAKAIGILKIAASKRTEALQTRCPNRRPEVIIDAQDPKDIQLPENRRSSILSLDEFGFPDLTSPNSKPGCKKTKHLIADLRQWMWWRIDP